MEKINKIDLFKSFVHDCLNDDIKQLENFSFWDIAGTKYDGTAEDEKNSKFDGDHSLIAKAIYWILWKDAGIPEFGEYNFDLVKNSYSGDTINTYNTLFGSSEEINQRVFHFLNLSKEEKKKLEKFYKLYQTIGNFYILPKNTINRESLNTYRGTRWNDFFDIFLQVLESGLNNVENVEKNFGALLKENDFFFSSIEYSIDAFCKLFYLSDEKENYNYLTDFHLNDSGMHFSHTMLCEKNKDAYKAFALSYIETASNLIEKRSKVIVRELTKIL